MNAAGIRDLAVAALKGKTDAGDRVFSPRDWPTFSGDYPAILIQTHADEKRSLGRNTPQFNTTTTLRITARLDAFDSEDEANGATKAELALEKIEDQIVRALINSYELTRLTQQYSSVTSQVDVNSEGSGHIGQLLMLVAIEYFQGPADFYPVKINELQGIDVTVKMPDGNVQPEFSIEFPNNTQE
ncbi:ATP-binding protein [Salmonella enterica subsp. enterica serovar Alachua]|nr:ATP-binding protein [Salmonella enterica subsp. enterica serovar Alachua]